MNKENLSSLSPLAEEKLQRR